MDAIKKQNMARAFAIDYAQSWIGTPYLWAGDDFSGFDCSGLIMEILQAAGTERRGDDKTAHAIIEHYSNFIINDPYAGCLIGIRRNAGTIAESIRIRHIGILITDFHVLHAGGGGSHTDSITDAIDQNAYVRVDPVTHFGTNTIFVDPFLSIT